MKKILIIGTVAALASTGAMAAKPGAEPAPLEYGYIGVSANVPANTGYSAVTQACRDTYGDQARMATSKEIMDEGVITGVGEEVWLQPIITNVAYVGSSSLAYLDYSGYRLTSQSGFSCAAQGSSGLIVALDSMVFSGRGCSSSLKVACSAPR